MKYLFAIELNELWNYYGQGIEDEPFETIGHCHKTLIKELENLREINEAKDKFRYRVICLNIEEDKVG